MFSRVLKLHFGPNCFDLVIDDVDKCLLMEVLNDMVDGYNSNGWELPRNPVLQYSYRAKNHHLTDDATLMRMFEVIKSKTIDIWVGCLQQPNFIWNLAQQTRKMNADSQPEHIPTVTKRLDKLPSRRSARNVVRPDVFVGQHEVDVVSLDAVDDLLGTPSHHQTPQPVVLDTPIHNQSPPINLTPPHNPSVEVIFPSPRRSPRFQTQPVTNGTTTNSSLPQNSTTEQPTLPNSTEESQLTKKLNQFPHGKKMPRSTAIMKGLYIPPSLKLTIPDQHLDNNASSSRASRRSGVVLPNPERAVVDLNASDDENDGDFELDEYSMDESDDDVSMSYEEGDIEELLTQNYVDANWDPNVRDESCPNDNGSLSKVFKNGEVYEEAEIGQIRLKLWQLFVDREHFKDTLRDFCIQEGFALVIIKSDLVRYTAECADERCNWRIHAAMLDDGCTWAIKSLQKKHNCDLNLVNNPMCNCELASCKLTCCYPKLF